MAIRFCPECKQMIPPGKLRSESKSCIACFRRTNPFDLIELDDNGNPVNCGCQKIVPKAAEPKQAYKSMWEDVEQNKNDFIQEGASTDNSRLARFLGIEAPVSGEVESSNALLEIAKAIVSHSKIDECFPEPMPLSQVKIPNNASWDYENGRQVLVFRANSSGFLIFFGTIWTGISLFALISLIASLSSVNSGIERIGIIFFVGFFVAIGVLCLYFGILHKYSRTWIDVEKDYLKVEHGLKRKGKQIIFRRNVDSILVKMDINSRENGVPKYYVEMVDKNDSQRKVRLADDASFNDALDIFNTAKALVVAVV